MWCTRRCLGDAVRKPAVAFVATDMDGTILSPKHVMSDTTRETLRCLSQKRRVPLIFATGRQHADVAVVVEHLKHHFATKAAEEDKDVLQTPLFLVCSNGAVVHDAWSGRAVSTSALPEKLVRELYTLLPKSETRINTHVMQRSQWFCRMNWEEMRQFHQESGFAYQVVPQIPPASQGGVSGKPASETLITHGDVTDVCQMSFTSWDRPLLQSLEQHLQKVYKDKLSVTFSAAYCVDIAPHGVNKAAGITKVFKELATRRQDESDDDDHDSVDEYVRRCLSSTVSFGDDLNDAPMLNAVGYGHVMANANPRLKVLCPHLPVIASNAEDGPARTLRKLFSLDD